MDKKLLHYFWTSKIRPIKVWYLLAIVLVSTVIAVFALRQNNLTMVKLRDQVYAADKNNQDVEGALQKLRAYVYGHMNTKLASGSEAVYPPIQLKYTYERLQSAAQAQAQQNNSQTYNAAQEFCEQQDSTDFSGRNRVPCVEKYVSEHGVNVAKIPDAMYKFDFVSPSWSPDLAGFSLAIAVIALILLILRVGLGYALKRYTR
jgi:preprotein translocase subunit SecF